MAQKRQAPDAPTVSGSVNLSMSSINYSVFLFQLPPRDGELSPPPIPPRLNHSTGYSRHSQGKEFVGKSSLLLPNTSSIMIRRNSAIEKRAAAAAQQSEPVMMGSGSGSMNTMLVTVSQPVGTVGTDEQQPPQSISPALSSSTTTSPLTPATPMSPNIPSHPVESTCTSSYARMRLQHNHMPHHHHHQHQHQQHSNQTQSRSSPKEIFPIATSLEGTPKLPPKPSLSANFYNNPGE